jgi:HK97 family phage prohead protease
MERRAVIELRAVSGSRRLEGYAATFGTPARIGNFTETIKPGAFRASLARNDADILALVDHDPARLLARTRSGTLRLAEDSKGLHFELDVPDTQLGRDVLTMAERHDLGGMSFGFRPVDEAWPTRETRELHKVDLVEVSVVHAHPAYASTSVAARARALERVDGAGTLRRNRLWLETL